MLTDGQELTSNRRFTIASPEFAQEHSGLIKAILEELQSASDWANRNPSQIASFLASQLGINVNALNIAIGCQTFEVLPVDEKIIAEQQGVADTFFRLGLVPKQIQIKSVVVQNPSWLPVALRQT